jgi:hypothetical protein
MNAWLTKPLFPEILLQLKRSSQQGSVRDHRGTTAVGLAYEEELERPCSEDQFWNKDSCIDIVYVGGKIKEGRRGVK